MRVLIAAATLMIWPQGGTAQVSSAETASDCINTAEVDAQVSMAGRLSVGTFTDPLGTEQAYLLELSGPACIDNGGEFADPRRAVTQVQVIGSDMNMHGVLQGSVGRRIRISGRVFAAHTRHHHRPMVVIADQVIPVGR